VHGDLKAANVLLTRGGEDVGGLWGHTLGYRVTAKVADFGLALQLDPKDTHATMAARVSGSTKSTLSQTQVKVKSISAYAGGVCSCINPGLYLKPASAHHQELCIKKGSFLQCRWQLCYLPSCRIGSFLHCRWQQLLHIVVFARAVLPFQGFRPVR
jgi:serine/threonine protein kinase